MDLTVGPARWPFTLEKRYIDLLAPDGTVLIVYLGWLSLGALRLRRVTADLFRPGAPVQRGWATASRPRGGEGRLDLGPACVDGEELRFETPGLSGRLRFRARHPPASPGAPLLQRGDRRIEWTVEIPDADAEAELRWPGGALRLAGRGYRDLVRMDVAPWKASLQVLRWGRIAAGDHASTWLRLEAAGQAIGAGWLDGAILPPERCEGRLGEPRPLLAGPIVDLDGIRLGPLRPILRRLAGDPGQAKWACPAQLLGSSGVAVHEEVRWR